MPYIKSPYISFTIYPSCPLSGCWTTSLSFSHLYNFAKKKKPLDIIPIAKQLSFWHQFFSGPKKSQKKKTTADFQGCRGESMNHPTQPKQFQATKNCWIELMNFRKLAGKKSVRRMFTKKTNTLPKFNSSPLSNPWLEAYISLLGFGNFSANCSTLRGYVLAGLGWAISLNRSHRRLKVQGSWKSGVFFLFFWGVKSWQQGSTIPEKPTPHLWS